MFAVVFVVENEERNDDDNENDDDDDDSMTVLVTSLTFDERLITFCQRFDKLFTVKPNVPLAAP